MFNYLCNIQFFNQIAHQHLNAMQLLLKYVLLFVCVFTFQAIKAQELTHWIKAGTNAPYQYSLQYVSIASWGRTLLKPY